MKSRFAVLSLALVGAFNLGAASVAVTSIDGGSLAGPSGDQLYGWFFTANTDINVLSLGIFDQNDDGLVDPHDVGIYRVSDQTLLGSATLPAGTGATLLNGFRYISVPAFGLLAGDYVIVATMPDDTPDGQWILANGVTTDPAITWTNSAFDGASTLQYPSQVATGFDVGMIGPNFEFETAAPEPGSALLLLGGGIAVGLLRRRSRA